MKGIVRWSVLWASAAILPAVASAQFVLATNDDNTIAIIGHTGSPSALSIPGTAAGLQVTRIGSNAFHDCWYLTSVTIPASVTNIEGYAFKGCTRLTNATIGCGVTRIGYGAFWACACLTSVTVPASVGDIEDYAFSFCTGLTNAVIGKGVSRVGKGAFEGCTRLTAIEVDVLNPAYSSVDGVLFDKNQTTLVQCPGGKAGSYTVPGSVTDIGGKAFEFCGSLKSVMIGANIARIGNNAFRACTNLAGVYFKGDVPLLCPPDAFCEDDNATVYYLSGTTGWKAMFAGCPTALWNPQSQGDFAADAQPN